MNCIWKSGTACNVVRRVGWYVTVNHPHWNNWNCCGATSPFYWHVFLYL